MKYITDMTDDEVLALSDEDLKNQIKLKMANEGIKLLQRPEEPTYEEVPQPDVTLYTVAGVVGYWEDKESAESVAKALDEVGFKERRVDYDYNAGHSKKYVRNLHDFEDASHPVTAEAVYSKNLYEQIRNVLEANSRLKKDYDSLKKEYEENESDAKWVVDEVYDRYSEVQREQQRKDDLKDRYNEYLELANNDSGVAMNFLKKAYPISVDDEYYVKGETSPQAAEPNEAPSS